MPDQAQNEGCEKPSARRARELIEKMSEQGEESKAAPELQPAKEFLNSIWQGNAIPKTPSGYRRFTPSDGASQSNLSDTGAGPDEPDANA